MRCIKDILPITGKFNHVNQQSMLTHLSVWPYKIFVNKHMFQSDVPSHHMSFPDAPPPPALTKCICSPPIKSNAPSKCIHLAVHCFLKKCLSTPTPLSAHCLTDCQILAIKVAKSWIVLPYIDACLHLKHKPSHSIITMDSLGHPVSHIL